MSTPRRLVVISLEDWDEVWRRNQYLVDGLLRSDPALEVLFVEPSADPLHALVNHRPATRGRGLVVVDGYQGRLLRFQPTKVLPRRLGASAELLLIRPVIQAVRQLGWTDPLLWINDPKWVPLLRATGWRSVYDITDDWVEADRGAREHALIAAADGELLARCDQVVVCSSALAAKKGTSRSVTLIRNAVDVARYRRDYPRPEDLPSRPVALYAGTLHEDRLDLDLVVRTARSLASMGARLVLLGPIALQARNFERLSGEPGVVLLGPRPSAAVPAYLRHADVLVTPHLVDAFTDSLDPIKLYEYLAAGRPVVSTAVAGFRDQPANRAISIAAGDSFVTTVLVAVAARAADSFSDRVPDWVGRGQEMRRVLDRLAEREERIA
jgi:teichuronic acid biosynthesis glycosyltransferase TuaH